MLNSFNMYPKVFHVELFSLLYKLLQAKGDKNVTICNWEGLKKKGFPLIFHGVVGMDEREGTSPRYDDCPCCFFIYLSS